MHVEALKYTVLLRDDQEGDTHGKFAVFLNSPVEAHKIIWYQKIRTISKHLFSFQSLIIEVCAAISYNTWLQLSIALNITVNKNILKKLTKRNQKKK